VPEIKTYIGCKIIQAYPLTLGEFNDTHGKIVPATPGEQGYLVRYPDGYESWSPKEVFEGAYREITAAEKNLI